MQRLGSPQTDEQTVPAGQSAVVSHSGTIQSEPPITGTRQTESPPSSSLQEQVPIAHWPSSVQVLPQLPLPRQVCPVLHVDAQTPAWQTSQGPPQFAPSAISAPFTQHEVLAMHFLLHFC